MSKLANLVPNFFKPVARPVYHWYLNKTIRRKSRNELHEFWKQPYDGDNSPRDYIEGEEKSQFLVKLVKNHTLTVDPRILEIGCNIGRNLNYLFLSGFKKLEGIEISENAVALMREVYPEMAKVARIHNSSVEGAIANFDDNAFDIVFTMACLQHIHQDSKFIFGEMVRITNKYLITIEDEKGISWRHFPRNYKKVFEPLGMKQLYQSNCREIEALGSNFLARVFAKI